MGKGSSFEREVCKQLGLWWSKGNRDDIFWRTAGSGAMAKTRSKVNKETFGQYGDVQAVDPIGQPLIDLCSIELKRGYQNDSLMDIFDRTERMKHQGFEEFILQARQDAKNAQAPYWLVISKRNSREAIITIPLKLYEDLPIYTGRVFTFKRPVCTMKIKLRPFTKTVTKWKDSKGKKHTHTEKNIIKTISTTVVSMQFNSFLKKVKRKHIEILNDKVNK